MAVKYDTSEIRSSARRIHRVSARMSEVSSRVSEARSSVPDALEGEAGDVLQELLYKLRSDMAKLSDGLEGISSQLYSFAAYLDWLDRMAAKDIASGNGMGG